MTIDRLLKEQSHEIFHKFFGLENLKIDLYRTLEVYTVYRMYAWYRKRTESRFAWIVAQVFKCPPLLVTISMKKPTGRGGDRAADPRQLKEYSDKKKKCDMSSS